MALEHKAAQTPGSQVHRLPHTLVREHLARVFVLSSQGQKLCQCSHYVRKPCVAWLTQRSPCACWLNRLRALSDCRHPFPKFMMHAKKDNDFAIHSLKARVSNVYDTFMTPTPKLK